MELSILRQPIFEISWLLIHMKGLYHRDRPSFVQKTTFIKKGLTRNSNTSQSKDSKKYSTVSAEKAIKPVDFRHAVGLDVMAIIVL